MPTRGTSTTNVLTAIDPARRLNNGQAEGYAAHIVTRVAIFAATSGRDPEAERRLETAFRRTRYDSARKFVNFLRGDADQADPSAGCMRRLLPVRPNGRRADACLTACCQPATAFPSGR